MTCRKTMGICLHMAVALVAACGSDPVAPNGTLVITTTTGGTQSDADGYSIAVDETAGQAIGPNATLRIEDLPAGTHRIVLDGLASNCAAAEGATRDVELEPGGEHHVDFRVTCVPSVGWLKIVAATRGDDLDDGYIALVDEGVNFALGTQDSVIVPRLTTGAHDVRLSEVASNCVVEGANPHRVTITSGAETRLEFTVVCVAPAAPPVPPGTPGPGTNPGTLVVTVRTTLINAPVSLQFGVVVDGGPRRSIPANGSLTVASIPQGRHTVLLKVANFCAVGGFFGPHTNPQTVNVPGNGTAVVRFDVLCIG